MVNAAKITTWINNPFFIEDKNDLLDLAIQFPYFSPLQYLKQLHFPEQSHSPFVLRQLYPVNPVLLYDILNKKKTAGASIPSVHTHKTDKELFEEPFPNDYFAKQGLKIEADLPEIEDFIRPGQTQATKEDTSQESTVPEQSLMVVMSFSEWLAYLQARTAKTQEEEAGKRALRAMWQKQRLAEAIEEESDEIPEDVFKMAVDSITQEDEIISESLAEVYARQGKKEKSIDIYKKLSLRNPEKKVYFATKIENLKKEIEL